MAVQARPTPVRLPSLTGLRFYAAAVVLLRHSVPELLPVPGLLQLSYVGPLGVSFFFVLSGFVLTWTWSRGATAGAFYGRRAARILPLHYLTTGLAVVVAFAVDPSSIGPVYWISAALSLLLLQGWGTESMREGGNGVSWSLSCEAFFYACFPILVPRIARLRPARMVSFFLLIWVAMGVWTVAYAFASRLGVPAVTAFSTYTNPLYRLGEFVVGIGLAVLVRQGWRSPLSLHRAIALTVATYVALVGLNEAVVKLGLSLGDARGLPLSVQGLLFLPVTALLIASAASSDVDGRPSPVGGKWHTRLGAWSFALYLVQMIVIVPLAEMFPASASLGVRAIGLVAVWVICLGAAALLHECFEQPLEKRLRRRWESRRA